MEAPSWARRSDGGWELTLRVQPGARTTAVVGALGDALKVRVSAPANDGKANAALTRYLAKALGVPNGAVTVIRGEHSRTKVVRIAVDADLARLAG